MAEKKLSGDVYYPTEEIIKNAHAKCEHLYQSAEKDYLGFWELLQWSQNALGQNWSDQPRLLKDQEFITTGPYRWIRHPIYAAFLVILGSTLLITANWLVGGLWILGSALDISARISFEESRILAQFDAGYRDYCSRTGALFPRL